MPNRRMLAHAIRFLAIDAVEKSPFGSSRDADGDG